MSIDKKQQLERIEVLLIDQALEGLDGGASAELEGLLALHPEVDTSEFELVAADVQLADLVEELDSMPAGLAERLKAQSVDFAVQGASADVTPSTVRTEGGRETAKSKASKANARAGSSSPLLAWVGWGLAAASLLFTFFALNQPISSDLTVAEARDLLVASATDLLKVDWSATEDDLVADQTIAGGVVWSDSADEGYMLFSGLPINDPTQTQYQLWIFDKARSAEQPVDGGVFDINSDGEVIVPIDPKLLVDEAFLFGITVERPGGVVVSEREHLVLLAQL